MVAMRDFWGVAVKGRSLAAANDIFAAPSVIAFAPGGNVLLVIGRGIYHVDFRHHIGRRFGLGMKHLDGGSADRAANSDNATV